MISSSDQPPTWRRKPPSAARSGQHASTATSESLASFREGPLPCLWGSVQFGDNIEDEWFITWLLQELTRRFPGTAVRIWDNDGDFLLIEAAYSLPRWLKPETASNRVWLLEGKLHIVPLPSASAPSIPSFPTLTQALQLVKSDTVSTAAGAHIGLSCGEERAGILQIWVKSTNSKQ